jgi:hypothetical protein
MWMLRELREAAPGIFPDAKGAYINLRKSCQEGRFGVKKAVATVVASSSAVMILPIVPEGNSHCLAGARTRHETDLIVDLGFVHYRLGLGLLLLVLLSRL